jgi:hypothetical protein
MVTNRKKLQGKENELQWRQNKKSDGTPLKDMRKMKKLKKDGDLK